METKKETGTTADNNQDTDIIKLEPNCLEVNIDFSSTRYITKSSESCLPLVSPNAPHNSYLFKLVILGATGVGKSCFVQMFLWEKITVKDQPTRVKETYQPTVILNNKTYKTMIIDNPPLPYLSGNSVSGSPDSSRPAKVLTAYIMMIDLNNINHTFNELKKMRQQMKKVPGFRSAPLVIVGTKLDLVCSKVSDHKAEKLVVTDFAKRRHYRYVECSSIENKFVKDVIKTALAGLDRLVLQDSLSRYNAVCGLPCNIS